MFYGSFFRGELPNSADGESRPVEPPVLFPEIGESHPCPFFKGPELNFITPRERKVKKVFDCGLRSLILSNSFRI